MALQLFKIADVTVSSPQSSISFTSIPQGYNDLILKMSVRCVDSVDYGTMTLNGSSTGFSSRRVYGDSTSALTAVRSDNYLIGLYNPGNYTANAFSSIELHFPNYTTSNNKCFSVDSGTENNGQGILTLSANLWSNTAAITSMSFLPATGNFAANTTATLYGVL